jgi:tRNA threonylcarbamoyladenosine biosynthesis protein TsaB
MVILALDSSAAEGSAAVLRDGHVTAVRAGDGSRTHGERLPSELMTILDGQTLALRDVDLFAVSIGPGSFTGLRVGIASIQGLALANGKLVVPVSTFDALAWQAGRDGGAVAAWIDARRGEVFAALYSVDGRMLRDPTSLAPAATLDAWAPELAGLGRVRFVGDGAVRYRSDIEERLGAQAVLQAGRPELAGAIAEIAARDPSRAVRPHAVVPLYVRRPDAELARDRAGRR